MKLEERVRSVHDRPSKEAVADKLAQSHLDLDRGLQQVIRLLAAEEEEAREGEPIKLLEINKDTVRAGIVPVYFGTHPSSGIFYPSVVVEIAPEEYNQETLE